MKNLSLTLVLVFLLTAFSPYEKKDLVGKWKINLEATQEEFPDYYDIKTQPNEKWMLTYSLQFKKDSTYIEEGKYDGEKITKEGTYEVKGEKLDMTNSCGTYEILSLSQEKLILRYNYSNYDEDIFHLFRVK